MPRWLWRAARGALMGVILIGAALAFILAAGAADPPRAGPLSFGFGPLPPVEAAPGAVIRLPRRLALPTPPYTLEVEARLEAGSDPLGWWGVAFDNGAQITVMADAYFALPPLIPESQPFFHIRPPGEANRLYVHVLPDGAATLRLNSEIAWEGNFPPARSAVIRAGGMTESVRLIVIRAALYSPPPPAR